MEEIYILVHNTDDEIWFQGTIEHWKDTFFSNPDEHNMAEFAEEHESKLYKQIKI